MEQISYKNPIGSVSSVSGLNKTTRSGFLAPTDSRRSDRVLTDGGAFIRTLPPGGRWEKERMSSVGAGNQTISSLSFVPTQNWNKKKKKKKSRVY